MSEEKGVQVECTNGAVVADGDVARQMFALAVENDVMREALQWCLEYFHARDEMDAKVHCAPVRWSEITLRVRSALQEVQRG